MQLVHFTVPAGWAAITINFLEKGVTVDNASFAKSLDKIYLIERTRTIRRDTFFGSLVFGFISTYIVFVEVPVV